MRRHLRSMHRAARLGAGCLVALAIAACGDGPAQFQGPAPLNAGPGTTSLHSVPIDNSGGGGGGSITGDWFFCVGEGADPCLVVDGLGLRLTESGDVVGLSVGGFHKTADFGAPYCELGVYGRYTISGNTLHVKGLPLTGIDLSGTFVIEGNRMTLSSSEGSRQAIRVSPPNSTGPCQLNGGPGDNSN